MGSFSVSCGITKLTISNGDDCILLPLITKKKNKGMKSYRPIEASHSSLSMFIYNTDMWLPFCFPIRGTYNDYGSIEDIIKNKNTETIEKYLNMSIEDFVELITDGRKNVYDSYSKFCEMFYLYPKDFGYEKTKEEFLEHLGFQLIKENLYVLDKIQVEIDEDNFYLINEDNRKCERSKEDFLTTYKNITGTYIGCKNTDKLELMLAIGGMFILGDVYDFFTKNHLESNNNIIEKESFPFIRSCLLEQNFDTKDFVNFKKNVNGKEIKVCYKDEFHKTFNDKSFYDMKDFLKLYKGLIGEDFDLSSYNGMDLYEWEMLELKKLSIPLIKRAIDIDCNRYKKYYDEYKKPNWLSQEDLISFFQDLYIRKICKSIIPFCGLLNYFSTLEDIYFLEIILGNLLEDFSRFKRLVDTMNLTNSLYVPSFAGTQCGCIQAEIRLAYITNKIVEERIEEYDFENNLINPLDGFNSKFY